MSPLPPAFLGVPDVAAILGIPTSRVYRLVAVGELPAGREGKSHIIPTPAVYSYASRRTRAMAHGPAAELASQAATALDDWAHAITDALRAAGEAA